MSGGDYYSHDPHLAKQKIERLEAQIKALQAEGVILCKDCRFRDYGKLSDDGRPYCWQTAWFICDDFFCYMAEPGEPYGKKEAPAA